jgi:hypothetical protein
LYGYYGWQVQFCGLSGGSTPSNWLQSPIIILGTVLAYGPHNSREQSSKLDWILENNPVWFGQKSGMKYDLEKIQVILENKNGIMVSGEKSGICTRKLVG